MTGLDLVRYPHMEGQHGSFHSYHKLRFEGGIFPRRRGLFLEAGQGADGSNVPWDSHSTWLHLAPYTNHLTLFVPHKTL